MISIIVFWTTWLRMWVLHDETPNQGLSHGRGKTQGTNWGLSLIILATTFIIELKFIHWITLSFLGIKVYEINLYVKLWWRKNMRNDQFPYSLFTAIHLTPKAWSEHGVEALWTGQRILFCPVHNASTPCSLQAFGIRCIPHMNLSHVHAFFVY